MENIDLLEPGVAMKRHSIYKANRAMLLELPREGI